MGGPKFQGALKSGFPAVVVSEDEAARIIRVYRETNAYIVQLWRAAQQMLKAMERGDTLQFGRPGVLTVDAGEQGILLPSGLWLRYPGLSAVMGEKGPEYFYDGRYGTNRIYGGKVVENVCQAIARCLIGEQMIRIAKRYRVVMTVHDSVVACVRKEEAEEAVDYMTQCMRWLPGWAEGLPIDCEVDVGETYAG